MDYNTDFKVPIGIKLEKFPALVFKPAFKKQTVSFLYSGKIEDIRFARFMFHKADIKFEWKGKFFKPQNDENDGKVMMEMDEQGNIKPDRAKLQ